MSRRRFRKALAAAVVAAACMLASSSTHAPAVLTAGAAVAAALAPLPDAHADVAPVRTAVRFSRPDHGRAPPSSAV